MKKLSPEAMAILDAARDVDDPTPDDRARVKRAVLSAVAASTTAVISATAASKAAASAAGTGAATSVAATTAATTATATAAAGSAAAGGAAAAGITGLGAVTAKALLTLSLVGASVGVAVSRPWEPEEPTIAVVESAVAEEATEEPGVGLRDTEPAFEAQPEAELEAEAEAEAEAELEAEAEIQAEPRVASAPRVVARAPAQPDTPPDTLAAELALLRRANIALGQGDHATALRALAEHEANFPRGVMIAERNGTRALVLCAAGSPGGREAGQRFLDTHPRSPIAQRIRDNCLE